MLKKKFLLKILIITVLLTFLKIDYRYDYTINCCSDDFDYFMHASTIALDFDFDYSNQFDGQVSYKKFGKQTPIGFVGSGIFSAPFLYIGNLLDLIFNIDQKSQILNFKLYFYSLSSVIYFLIGFIFLYKFFELTETKPKKNKLFIFYFVTGLPYFAFERYSMTHVYEVFSIIIIIYLSGLCYSDSKKNKTFFEILIPLFLLISFLTRMSNFYIFLIPIIVKKLYFNDTYYNISKKFSFILSSFISLIIYYLISNELYGKMILNPAEIYGNNENYIEKYVVNNSLIEFLISFLNTIKILLFSYEFGILWFTPIVFFGFITSIYILIKNKDFVTFVILVCYLFNFGIIHIWQSTASSYGFRYLFSLIPLSTIIVLKYIKNSKIIYFITLMSIISIVLLLFFETNYNTQLSTDYIINSFNNFVRYSQPNYLPGVIEAMFSLNSYLIIFSTSFLGSIFFKIFFSVFDYEKVFLSLEKLNLPIYNSDFQNLLIKLEEISFFKLFLPVLIFYLFTLFLSDEKLQFRDKI